jgi:hypothetical protein
MSINQFFNKKELQKIKLTDENNNIICELFPLNNLEDVTVSLLELLVKWRNKSMRYFKTQFKAEVSTTEIWLKKNIIENNCILFIIIVNKKPVGHYGLRNISEEKAELDNAIRGERGGVSNLFINIEKYLIQFCFNTLKVKSVIAKVLSNNYLALTMHEELGFVVDAKYPLKLIETDEKKELVECTNDLSNVPYVYLELKLINIKNIC